VFQGRVFFDLAVGGQQDHGMFFVGPIEADKRGKRFVRAESDLRVGVVHKRPLVSMNQPRGLGTGEVLIGETLHIDILSIRFSPKRRPESESLA
jgi:hypothetical protein